MRIARFRSGGAVRLGVVTGEEVADLGAVDPAFPADTVDLLALGADGLDRAARLTPAAPRLPLADVTVLAPVARPPKLLAIALNYVEHAAETARDAPSFPVFFNKQSTCVIGPGEAIHKPRASDMVDFEGELAMVIGRRCRHVPAERAPEVVAGYTVINDVTARDWQLRAPTMTLGKSFDTHGPTGPFLVTADEVGDPHDLRLRTWVNGRLMQDASTGGMVFDCWRQIETLTTAFTLEPGDVVATGTPAGVGFARTPPVFLGAGDRVRIEIEAVGTLENPVVDEPDDTGRW